MGLVNFDYSDFALTITCSISVMSYLREISFSFAYRIAAAIVVIFLVNLKRNLNFVIIDTTGG